jgi:hypothetical protein
MGALKTPPKMYRKQVEDILRKYPLYKQALKFRLYPSVTMDYETERVDGGEKEYASSTEKYGIIRAEYSRLVEQVDEMLEVLSDQEIELIARSYFKEEAFVWEVLGLSRASYYIKRNDVLDKLAIVCNLTH